VLPYYRQRAHSRIYRLLYERQQARVAKRAAGRGIVAQVKRLRGYASAWRHKDQPDIDQGEMSSYSGAAGGWRASAGEALKSLSSQEPGTRRKKLAGYLQAANEMRQNVQQSYLGNGQRGSEFDEDGERGMPGSFPDVEIARSGNEEMIVFPGYAMRHVKREKRPPPVPTAQQHNPDHDDGYESPALDADYWKDHWKELEDDKAIVDIDIRGWIYTPHSGPLNRKNRILVGLARRLSGIPAPSNHPDATSSIPIRAKHEEEAVEREAEEILDRGEDEAYIAAEGKYSEDPRYSSDRERSRGSSGHSTPRSQSQDGRIRSALSYAGAGASSVSGFVAKRSSAFWTQQPPPNMTPEELEAANANLIARLRPFLALPAIKLPVTIFFYNKDMSQSRTTYTDESGQFYVRACLDFVPTHARVLASESLATVQDIKIVETQGVSLISDIDDTIKHSAVTSGAREIFRNTFVKEYDSMAIEGVKEWYGQLYKMGVQVHYVSNSPWQVYPLLTSFFAMAGLPPGSFHLKQYSGMLQGIFEPVAERKKGTLERIFRDFPERKFILVGDSGEADLEVYTDVVTANPGRVLGVFIRDVTTPKDVLEEKAQEFFKPSQDFKQGRFNDQPSRQEDENLIDFSSDSDMPSPAAESLKKTLSRSSPPTPPPPRRSQTNQNPSNTNGGNSGPPARPAKPLSLKSASIAKANESEDTISPITRTHTAPPIPPKPRPSTSVSRENIHASPTKRSSSVPADEDNSGISSSLRERVNSVYNSLPAASSYIPSSLSSSPSNSTNQPSGSSSSKDMSAFPPPPRRTPLPQPGSSRLSVSQSSGASTPATSNASAYGQNMPQISQTMSQSQASPNKRLEMWSRRWEKAEDIFHREGVVLRTWTVGKDVQQGCIALVERALRDVDTKSKP
jgi:phosphatidate phosphatase APP1